MAEMEQTVEAQGTAQEAAPSQVSNGSVEVADQRPQQDIGDYDTPLFNAPKQETTGKKARPEGFEDLPDKFWDEEKGEVRIQSVYKAWRDLDTHMKNKTNPNVPETYELNDVLEAGGFQVTNEEQWGEFMSAIKEKGFTNDQAAFMVDIGSKWLQQQLIELGPPVNREAERASLVKHYGSEDAAKEAYVENLEWAKANLPKEVYRHLVLTKEGALFLEGLRKGERGPVPLTGNPHIGKTADELEAEADALIASPNYRGGSDVARNTQKRVKELLTEVHRLRSR